MRLLLDTHIVLWWFTDNPALPRAAYQALAAPESDVFVSAATVWEIAIKRALGRLTFPIERIGEIFADAGFTPLPIDIHHAREAGALPALHQDPFDRMMIAQARCESMTLVSADATVNRYEVPSLLRE